MSSIDRLKKASFCSDVSTVLGGDQTLDAPYLTLLGRDTLVKQRLLQIFESTQKFGHKFEHGSIASVDPCSTPMTSSRSLPTNTYYIHRSTLTTQSIRSGPAACFREPCPAYRLSLSTMGSRHKKDADM